MKTLLFLDDDADLRELVCPQLRNQGVRVIEATRASEALQVLEREAVDLIVVDGLLPDVRGIQFIEGLRNKGTKTKVVFVSAFFRDKEVFRRLTKELNVTRVYYKPFDADDFVRGIGELIGSAVVPRPSGIQAELEQLRQGFAARLPERIAELEKALALSKTDEDQRAQARTIAHRLRGTCGTYGFASIGGHFGRIEDALGETGTAISRKQWNEVQLALGDARQLSAPATTAVEADRATKTVLLVDDDPEFLIFARQIVRNLPIDIVTAQSSSEALQRTHGKHLAAAILDVHLGASETFGLARDIRATAGNAELPIAFLSADDSTKTRVAAALAGGSVFLDKPVDGEALVTVLEGLLRSTRRPRSRVLAVDDDKEILRFFHHHLENAGYEVQTLSSAEELFEHLDGYNPTVILLDQNLPKVSGVEICRALSMSEKWKTVPRIIVSASTDVATKRDAFSAGATDFMTKPVAAEELLVRVDAHINRLLLERDGAERDALTGLFLRRAFTERWQREFAMCERHYKPASLMIIDVDNFKAINDQHGHVVGDEVLRALGGLLKQRFRIEDLRCRWGGEEFLVAFFDMGPATTVTCAEALLEEFTKLRFSGDSGEQFNATFSAGIAAFPDDGLALNAMLKTADARLYQAKKAGRNRIVGANRAQR